MRTGRPEILALVFAAGLIAWAVDGLHPAPDLGSTEPVRAVINIWVQLAIMLVSAILSYALAPKPPAPKPASITDFDIPTAEEGRPIPVVFGTVLITGPNVLWYGDLTTQAIKKKGGKK